MSDTRNVKLGVCSVIYDGVDLGYTKGGVEVEVQTGTKQVEVDQFGNSPINEYILSRSCMVTVPLAETTLENLVQIMPGATLSQTGGAKASGTITLSTAAPSDGDTVTVNGVVYTFKTVPVAQRDVLIGSGFADSADNLVAVLNDSTDLNVVSATYEAAAGVITVTFDTFGVEGNAFTLAENGTNIVVSGATLTGGLDSTGAKVVVTNAIGVSLLDNARKLVLHPIANADDNREDDFIIPIAATPGALQFSYKLDEERIFPVTFMAYPDPATKVLFIVGDDNVA